MVGKCESFLSPFSSLSCLTRIIVGTSVKYQAGKKKKKNSSGILHRIPTVWHRMMQLVDCQKSHVISAFFMFADMLNLCIACLRIFFVPLMLAYNLRKGLLKIWTKHSLKLQEMKFQSREGLRGIQSYTRGLDGPKNYFKSALLAYACILLKGFQWPL